MITSSTVRSYASPVPLRSPSVPRAAALPRPLTSFVGWEREVAAVSALLGRSDVRLVTLTGPGGAGKTRMAVQVARSLADTFAGVWFVPLDAIRDPGLVVPTVAQALGLREAADEPVLERISGLFGGEPHLLVLDNFEQVVEAAPFLTDLLSLSPRLSVLVTSREVLHVTGEHDYPVPTLEVPSPALPVDQVARSAAVDLFVQRARAARPDFALSEGNAGAVGELCRRLDGLPLAIELAAAHSRILSPAALLARLSDRLTLLAGGPRDQPPRLRAMRDAIDWTYDLLSEEEQALFRRLAVFVDGFTEDAAAAVYVDPDVNDFPLMDRLGALLDKSLLQQEWQADGEPRLRMLETVREYGLARLSRSGEEDAARAAHADYYLQLAEQAEPRLIAEGSAAWVQRLAAERANLRAAVAWALDGGQTDAVLRLAGTILSLAYARGEPGEGGAWLEAALASPGEVAPELKVDALFVGAALLQVQGEFPRSVALGENALALARASGYSFGAVRALLGLGITAEWQGDLNRAAALYEESLEVMRSLGEPERLPHWTVLPLANLADVALLRGDPAHAMLLGEEAVQQWRGAGYVWGIAQALGTVAAAASDRGDQVRSAGLYEEALDCWLGCDDGRGVAGTLAGIAALARARGQVERAGRLLGAAWAMADALGVRFLAHHVYAERVLAATRSQLDGPTFEAAWATGRGLALDEAVAEARAALRDLPPNRPNGLTHRELDVLRLIVAGHPDREIAATLSISPRTVQSHSAGLFAKLGVSSRAAAAALAVRRGLV
jgi:non-specific serine/threonine protein kinase